MRIGIAQLNTRAGDFDATSSRMEEAARSACEQGVDLLVFPLMTLTGPYPPDYADQSGYMFDLSGALVRLSESLACPCVVPIATDFGGRVSPEVMLLSHGSITPLCNRDDEESRPEDMRSTPTFEFEQMRMGLTFTYDDIEIALEEGFDPGLDVLLFISGYSYALDDPSSVLGAALAENRYCLDAKSLDAWVVGVGSLGGYGRQVYTGSSFVLTPAGELVASAPAFEEALVVAELGHVTPAVVDVALEPEIYDRTLHLWEALGLGLRDYLEKQGAAQVALVLRNSLSSCLLAVLASDSLGPTRVHALLGVPGNDPHAPMLRNLAASLHIHLEEPTPAEVLGAWDDDELALQLARLARRHDCLAVSNEDKTYLALEVGASRCRSADLLPFGDVYRTDLVELAHLRNTISPVIPVDAFHAVGCPSVGGIEDVEPTLETRLRRVDTTLATHVEWERSVSDAAARQGEPELTSRIIRRLHGLSAVRSGWPPSLVVSSRPLSEVRETTGWAWEDRVRDRGDWVQGRQVLDRVMQPKHMDAAADMPKNMSAEISALLDGLDAELVSGSLPEGVDRSTVEAALGDLLGLIQDITQQEGQQPDGPFGPMTWGSPFSEN